MNGLGILLLAVLIALPMAWLVAEFKASRAVRVGLGVCAFGLAIIFTYGLASVLTRFNYNAWFGQATKILIETSVTQIEDGHFDRVLKVWRGLNAQYHPSYENRAGYKDLVDGATQAMKEEQEGNTNHIWDVHPFNSKNWLGHWENDTGYWIVINDIDRPLDITRSGHPPTRMHSVAITDDHRILKFKEGEDWLHTLTLKNKYEATHEWFDLKQQKIWQTDTLHKLRRASDAEKVVTQQSASQPVNP
jgi:hypothetical protein